MPDDLTTLPDVISRKKAMESGLTRYFTGKPCSKGHIDYRYTCDHTCFACARMKSARQKAENPEAVKRHQEARKEKYRSDPATREKTIERVREWTEENKDRRTEYMREYYASNKEKLLQDAKVRWDKYRQDPDWVTKERARCAAKNAANPETKRSAVRTRRARIRNAEGTHNAADIKDILEKQKYKCVYCRSSLKDGYDVDHVIPISRGGSNWPSNLQCLCPSCNGKKWSKDPIAFAQEHGMLL